MYKYTLCFIKRNEEILMLNREYAPVKGLWNGVGGKIEARETPLENAIREIKEETHIDVKQNQIQFKGIIKWEDSSYSGGMYDLHMTHQKSIRRDFRLEKCVLDIKRL
ncbi:hypothetical protein ICU_02513 [Bacillus cereus BAG2X1-1]|nr:hypothetical protein ICU_02513 [Bacillus cereus BAG2X1-1]